MGKTEYVLVHSRTDSDKVFEGVKTRKRLVLKPLTAKANTALLAAQRLNYLCQMHGMKLPNPGAGIASLGKAGRNKHTTILKIEGPL